MTSEQLYPGRSNSISASEITIDMISPDLAATHKMTVSFRDVSLA